MKIQWKNVSKLLLDELKAMRAKHAVSLRRARRFAYAYLGISLISPVTLTVGPCEGPSMLPTIRENGDFILIDRFSYGIMKKEYARGDIVVGEWNEHRAVIVKRISAVAGDCVTHTDSKGKIRSTVVPPYHVWLLGDNPAQSTDSREFGPFSVDDLYGKAIVKCSIFPCRITWL